MTRPPNRGTGRFATPLRVEYLDRGESARVLEDFAFVDCNGRRWITPKDFIFDGASVPRPLWPTCGPPLYGPNVFIGAVHDPRYRFADCTKAEADMLLWDVALLAGHSEEIAAAIYEGVHLFGFEAWNSNAEKREICGSDRARLLAWA